jgi:hypothetical protein
MAREREAKDMSKMIERVANAIRLHAFDPMEADEAVAYACIVVAVMREPTKKMSAKGANVHTGYYDLGDVDLLRERNAIEIWQAMIYEALVEE